MEYVSRADGVTNTTPPAFTTAPPTALMAPLEEVYRQVTRNQIATLSSSIISLIVGTAAVVFWICRSRKTSNSSLWILVVFVDLCLAADLGTSVITQLSGGFHDDPNNMCRHFEFVEQFWSFTQPVLFIIFWINVGVVMWQVRPFYGFGHHLLYTLLAAIAVLIGLASGGLAVSDVEPFKLDYVAQGQPWCWFRNLYAKVFLAYVYEFIAGPAMVIGLLVPLLRVTWCELTPPDGLHLENRRSLAIRAVCAVLSWGISLCGLLIRESVTSDENSISILQCFLHPLHAALDGAAFLISERVWKGPHEGFSEAIWDMRSRLVAKRQKRESDAAAFLAAAASPMNVGRKSLPSGLRRTESELKDSNRTEEHRTDGEWQSGDRLSSDDDNDHQPSSGQLVRMPAVAGGRSTV